MVLFCWKDGALLEDSQCPQKIIQVDIAPLAAGPVRIPQWRSTLSPYDPEEADQGPCEGLRYVESQEALPAQDVGRQITLTDVKSSTYRRLIQEASGAAEVNIQQLARIDLDGNGTEEVLFEVNSHEGFMLEGPTHLVSLVGMRAIVDGEVKTFIIHDTQKTLKAGEQIHYWQRGSLLGVTDVEGDGRLEVVLGDHYYEGGYTGIFTFDGKQLKHLAGNGCGA